MEFIFPSFSILLMFLLFLFMVMKFKTNCQYSKLAPGPLKLPFIGNLHQLVGSLPHHRLRDLAKKYGPFMHLQLGEISTLVVSSPEFAKEVMKTHDIIFASRPQSLVMSIITYGHNDLAMAPCGDYWRQLRKIFIVELLSVKRAQSFRSIRQEEVSNLVDVMASKAGSVINLTEKISSLLYVITARAAFGKKCEDQQAYMSAVQELMTFASGFSIVDLFPSIRLLQSITGIKSQVEKLFKQQERIIEKIICEHKHKPREEDEDLVDVLLKLQDKGDFEIPLATNNIKALITDIFSAGSETSSTVIVWAVAEMIKNPRLMKMAQAEVREIFNRNGNVDETCINEMKFLKLVIKETLRLHPPAPFLLPRESRERCEVNGFNIPAKTKVMINAWAIGRDPKYWTEPEIFNPDRFLDSSVDFKGTNFEYIPFGAGRRICPGIPFGLANVELCLAMLLYHFDWKLPNGMKHEDLDMKERFGLTTARKDDLFLIPIPYHPSPVA